MNATVEFFKQRRAGILLHPTSLPTSPGNGDLGKQAYHFIDFLVSSGLSVWQMLPLGPPHEDLSPYQCQSVHAANPALICLDLLVEKGWLHSFHLPKLPQLQDALNYRYARLKEARVGFNLHANQADKTAFQEFVAKNAFWLEDYALFRALKIDSHHKAWWQWEPALRDRKLPALHKAQKRLAESIEQQRFEQFVFFDQWQALKQYAHEKGISLFGDMPIFVAGDSADVWAQREYFLLDKKGQPTVVAGVPPDYFSATGQRWGNPLYNWEAMQADDFTWWIKRLETAQVLFDVIRIDHFRGFEACWSIPASEPVAINGEWVEVPGKALFEKLEQVNTLPLVAEDLGVITEPVIELRDRFGLPGMKILQFAFDSGSDNPYLPHNHVPNSIVYTGTHDNNTTLGWFKELPATTQHYMCEYLHTTPYEVPWNLVEAAFASVARLAIIPMQDILVADADQRMNTPGTAQGNWLWRFEWSQLPVGVSEKLKHWAIFYERT